MALLEYIKDALGFNVRRTLRELEEDISRMAYHGYRRATRFVINQLSSMLLMVVSFIFFAVGAVYFFIEYIQLSKTLSFLIVGAIILLISLVLRMRN